MIKERPWVIGGLISAALPAVLLGFFVMGFRGGSESGAGGPSSVIVADSSDPTAPSTVPAGSPSTPSAATKAKATKATKAKAKATKAAARKASAAAKTAKAKAKAKGTAKAKKATKTSTASQAVKKGAGGAGEGRIQRGKTYTGQATFYAATGEGNCSFEASSDLMVGAMNQADYENSQACGAYLSVTGPNGSVTIKIVDRCPECPPGAIDLSREAFEKIAPVSAGRVSISWHLLSPDGLGPVSYRYKTGSSQYWCAIQVRNHRNPVRSVQLKTGSGWKTLDRQTFNYFLSEGGAGCGGTIRVTDIFGNQLTDTGIEIAPDKTQRGRAQFPS